MTVPFMRAYTELLVRTCHRRGAHAMGGMAPFIPSRKDPRSTSRRSPRSARTSCASPATASTAPGWRTRTSCRSRWRSSRRRSRRGRTRRTGCARRSSVTAGELVGHARAGRVGHRGRVPQQRQRGAAVPELVAPRKRRGRDLQPHGGRRDGRDLALAALAVDAQRREALRRPAGRPRALRAGEGARSSRGSAARPRGACARRSRSSTASSEEDEFAEFLTLPAYAHLE